jgi:hypothetical protein
MTPAVENTASGAILEVPQYLVPRPCKVWRGVEKL